MYHVHMDTCSELYFKIPNWTSIQPAGPTASHEHWRRGDSGIWVWKPRKVAEEMGVKLT